MKPARHIVCALCVLLWAGSAEADDMVSADPCDANVIDPHVTPVRDVELDVQRSACLREDISLRVLSHALIDTPGFYGNLGGNLSLGGRLIIGKAHELSAQLRVVDYTFVQNAVNKVGNTGFGPLVLGAAAGDTIGAGARGALVLQVELPYTRDQMDTLRTNAALTGVVTGRLTDSLLLHTRLGALGMHASSEAGSTRRLAFRAGADVAWHVRTRVALHAGSEISAGWYGGFDHVLLRAGVHWKMTSGWCEYRNDWRLRAGVGAPFF